MKIVVTGAIGHIGSYVVRDLGIQFPNAEITMIDNMMTQRYPSLFNLPTKGNYHFIEGDVNSIDLKSVFSDANVVIHLAAITDAAGSFDRPEELENNNYQSTVKVANACIETGSSLIALSSTSVYGTQNDVVDENCSEEELQPLYTVHSIENMAVAAEKLHREMLPRLQEVQMMQKYQPRQGPRSLKEHWRKEYQKVFNTYESANHSYKDQRDERHRGTSAENHKIH